MGFFKKTPEFDLGELNIENIFITDFMPSASGTTVKVYLLGILFSKEENTKYHYDNKTLANMLSLPLQDVHEAWTYWEKVGLIIKHAHEDASAYDVEFLSLRALYIQNNYNVKNSTVVTRTKKAHVENNPFKIENENFQKLTKSVEKIIGHPLTYSDYREIGDFYENYSKDIEWLERAFVHCYQERGIRNLKVVKSTMLSWIDQGLNTVSAVDAYLVHSSARYQIYKEVLRLLGNAFRMVNQGEKDLIDKWIDTYAFGQDDLYAIIKDLSKKTMTINFNYIDTILTKLNQSGIKTFEAYTTFNAFASKQGTEKPESKPTHRRKNYTIEKDKTYSEEELESILLNKNK